MKMAIRTYYVREGIISGPEDALAVAERLPQVRVGALDGSYHGDTLGTMDMQAPSVFTDRFRRPGTNQGGCSSPHPHCSCVRGGGP